MIAIEGRTAGEFIGGFEFIIAPVGPDSLHEGFIPTAPVAAAPAPTVPGRPALSVEHEARGLLNVIVLLTRCMELEATVTERAGWARDIEAAKQRLEQMYAAGLDRHFHKQM